MARIGILTTSYPRSDEDIAGLFVRGMARALSHRGHSLEVLAPAAGRGAPPQEPGVEVGWVRYAPAFLSRTFYGAGVPDNVRDPLAWPGLATFPAALWLRARAAARGWDAIVSHWALPCALVAAEVRRGRPHLAVLHSADVHLLSRLPGRGAIVRRILAGADALLFSSSALRKQLLSWLPPTVAARASGRCHAHAMGIDVEPPSADRRALRRRLGLSRFTVLVLGRLVPVKGVEVALRALSGVDGVELIIAGEGPGHATLRTLAEERGVRVRFLGTVTGPEKADLLHAVHALVLPSIRLDSGRSEGTPTSLLEAAHAGLPIVASRVGGVEEVVADERSALLVAPGDEASLRAALIRLRDDAALRRRLGRAATSVGKRYTWATVAPMVESLLFDSSSS